MLLIAEFIIALLLVIGGLFGLVGSFGLVKLDDPMKRLHAPTMSATLGVGAVLVASMLYAPVFLGWWSWHELLITLFVTLVAPVTGYFIAKANIHQRYPASVLPSPGRDQVWATHCPDDILHEEDVISDPQR